MATARDLSITDRLWLRTYQFRRVEPLAWSPPERPLSRCRVAIVSTAGLYGPEDEPFRKVKGGDYSFRVVPRGAALDELRCTHPSSAWDREGVARDPNLAFPLDRLEELAEDGAIGNVAPRHLSFQGSITAPGRLLARTAPEAAGMLGEDGVHIALLVPV